MRYALITCSTQTAGSVPAYLPDNYLVISETPHPDRPAWRDVTIAGKDNRGWTLDGYVIPRLASGLIFATEITLGTAIERELAAQGVR